VVIRTMWLEKDERRLLREYYRQLGSVDTSKLYQENKWLEVLKYGRSSGAIAEWDEKEEEVDITIAEYIKWSRRLRAANHRLVKRGLIRIQKHQAVDDVFDVQLTIDGYDLGRRYSSFLGWTGLWFQAYREHWLWLLAAAVGGGIVTWLLSLLKG